MKLPLGLLDTNGARIKGHVYLLSSDGKQELNEYGLEKEGSIVSCYVQTAAEDIISLTLALNALSVDLVDVVIDGIRRYSVASEKSSGHLRAAVKRVLYMGLRTGGRRGGLKTSLMQVKARDKSDNLKAGDPSSSTDVGSIIVQLFQKQQSSTADPKAESEAARYPDFEKYATWKQVPNNNGCQNGKPSTSMEIDLIDGNKVSKTTKEKNQRSYTSEYQVVATLVFKLCSTSDLRALNKFGDIPDYPLPGSVTEGQRHTLSGPSGESKAEGKGTIKGINTKREGTEDPNDDETADPGDDDDDDDDNDEDDDEKGDSIIGSESTSANNTPEMGDAKWSNLFTPKKQKLFSLPGTPEAPAYLGWVKRDLGLEAEKIPSKKAKDPQFASPPQVRESQSTPSKITTQPLSRLVSISPPHAKRTALMAEDMVLDISEDSGLNINLVSPVIPPLERVAVDSNFPTYEPIAESEVYISDGGDFAPPKEVLASVARKRKTLSISDTEIHIEEPRKRVSKAGNPMAVETRDDIALELLAVNARLEAAKKRNQELEKDYARATSINQTKLEIKKTRLETERLERKNDELLEKINALQNS